MRKSTAPRPSPRASKTAVPRVHGKWLAVEITPSEVATLGTIHRKLSQALNSPALQKIISEEIAKALAQPPKGRC